MTLPSSAVVVNAVDVVRAEIAVIAGGVCRYRRSSRTANAEGSGQSRLLSANADVVVRESSVRTASAIWTAPCLLWVASDTPRAHAHYRRNVFSLDGATKIEKQWESIQSSRMIR